MTISQNHASGDHEALDWAIRMGQPDADWDAFTVWLEANEENSARYDRASASLLDIDEVVLALPTMPVLAAANDVGPASRNTWHKLTRWAGGAALAAAIGTVGLTWLEREPHSYLVRTEAGQQRTVSLADGSRIQMAGGSVLRLQSDDARLATVEQGQMVFHVTHNTEKPFAVRVGDLQLVDLGTVFDVKATPSGARVAVAEGAVMVDPRGAALRLGPGQMIVADGTTLQRRQVPIADVGEWREGRLVFDQAPLDEVAADLSRELSISIRSDPAVAKRPFSGTLEPSILKGHPEILGGLLGVRVREVRAGWTLDALR